MTKYISSIRYRNSVRPVQIGDCVRISRPGTQSYGLMGKVVGFENLLVLVKFIDWHGTPDKILRFLGDSLTLVAGESQRYLSDNSEHMEDKAMANKVVTGNYDVAFVTFAEDVYAKEYGFALFDAETKAGDHVLVDSNEQYRVAKVSSIIGRSVYQGDLPTKEVICKVDFAAFNRRKEVRKQKEILRRQMDELVSQNKELILYQAVAKDNPKMAAMLEKYMALGNEV